MAETYIDPQQAKPGAGVLTTLYTVPALTSFVQGTIIVCNQGSVVEAFRISIAPGGAADAPSQYIAYDTTIMPNDTVPITVGMTSQPATQWRVQSRLGNLSFSLGGVQIT